MKLLVTGGSGFLGRRVSAHFEALGRQVFTPGHGELDIVDISRVREWFRVNQSEAVIHTAAVSDTGLCQKNPAWSARINVDGCVNLAQCCREIGARLVLCSSDQVYFGSRRPGPHSEAEDLTPGNVYGQQKLLAEQKCLEILPEAVCLRLSWMYSVRSYPGEHGHFLTTLKAALEDPEKPLSWPIHDHRGLTNADTVVKNLEKALELPGGVYNFGSENRKNTYETVKDLLASLGREDALARLTPNREAFADAPRDITMNLDKCRGAGICFPTTGEGLYNAMKEAGT